MARGRHGLSGVAAALLAVALVAALLAPSPAAAHALGSGRRLSQAAPKITPAAPKAGSGAAAPKPAAAAAPKAAAPGGKTFHIGCLVPLSGGSGKANTGKAVQAAIEMAIKDYQPKLPGVKIELTCKDTQCADVASLRAAQTLARASGVDALVGDVCSAASLAATGVANKYQLPMISPASTSMALSTAGDYFFRTVPSDRYQGQYAARKMLDQGAKKIVVAYSDGSYGQGLSFSIIAAFTKEGGKAFPVAVPLGSSDISGVLAEIQKQQPDGVFIASNQVLWGADLIKTLKSKKSNVKVFLGDSMMDPTVAEAAGKANAVGIRGTDVSFGTPAFVKAFNAHVAGKDINYVAKASHAYDAAQALLEAYRRAAEPKGGPQILAELPNVKFMGKAGPVAFDEYGDLKYDPATSYDISEFKADGSVAVVPK